MSEKLTKTITGTYTTTDDDNYCRIICHSSTPFTITLHSPTGRYNFELEIDNIGAGTVTCGGQTIPQNSHAHVGNNGGTSWVVVVGGGSLTKSAVEAVLTGEISSHNHAAYTLPQATNATLGGIKANAKTSAETVAVKIDTASGMLYVPPSDAAANGLPAGGSTGQVLAKTDDTNYNAQWVTPSSSGTAIDSDWGTL